jgi:hypothetical protein
MNDMANVKERRSCRAMSMTVELACLGWLTVAGCAGGEDVTGESIGAARARWAKAEVRDYDIEWESSGLSSSHYVVAVRNGQVRTIEGIAPDGRRFPVKPPEPRFYGVEGLFMIIADELAQLETETPFGKPKGTKAVLRFRPDAVLGYPKSYRRDVLGSPMTLPIDVIRFTPSAVVPRPSQERVAPPPS